MQREPAPPQTALFRSEDVPLDFPGSHLATFEFLRLTGPTPANPFTTDENAVKGSPMKSKQSPHSAPRQLWFHDSPELPQ